MKTRVVVWFVALLAAPSAHAGGLFIPGIGPQAQGRAGAFVAKADDATAIAHNPAGFAKIQGIVAYVGANMVNLSLDYTRAGQYESDSGGNGIRGQDYPTVSDDASPTLGAFGFQAVPLVAVGAGFAVPAIRGRVGLGAGLYAPQAFPNRAFPETVKVNGADAPAPMRYDIVTQKAETALPSFVAAVQLYERIDLGVRLSSGFSKLFATTATWGVQTYEEDARKDGVFTLDVHDSFVPTWGAGILVRPIDAIEVGFAYAASLEIRAKGEGKAVLGEGVNPLDPEPSLEPPAIDFDCEPGGERDALRSCVDLDLPQQVTGGVRWIWHEDDGSERADAELDVSWENWGSERASDYGVRVDAVDNFAGKRIQPTFIKHGLKDVISVRLGGSYRVPMEGNPLRLRAGIAYDTEAAPENWTRADFDSAPRTTMGLGGSYDIDRFRIDFGLGYVLQPDREVANDCSPDTNGPMATMAGCNGVMTTVPNRERPDPLQPLGDSNSAFESPFNAGTYESSYLLFSLGVAASF